MLKSDNLKIGITFGAFDLLHAGHAEFLMSAGYQVDQLIIGLHIDPSVERSHKNKPVQSMLERFWQLRAIAKVTSIIPYETESDIERMLGLISGLTHYFVGGDHKFDKITGDSICQTKGINIYFIPRYHDYSTTELRQRVYNHESKLCS
jgi:glycerol-3-phosphate cytidylyltransferase